MIKFIKNKAFFSRTLLLVCEVSSNFVLFSVFFFFRLGRTKIRDQRQRLGHYQGINNNRFNNNRLFVAEIHLTMTMTLYPMKSKKCPLNLCLFSYHRLSLKCYPIDCSDLMNYCRRLTLSHCARLTVCLRSVI